MKRIKILIIVGLAFVGSTLKAQIDFSEQSTEKIKNNPELEPSTDQKQRRLLSIYVKDTKNVLYGNPCMDAVTSRFGYEYVVMPKNARGFSSGLQKAFHNFFVKTALFFRNPFWKIISNKKAKECRQKTGDYTG